LYTWWDYYCESERDPQLAIVVMREQGEVTAILPGYTHSERILGCPRRAYSLLGSAHESSDYLDVIGPIGGRGDTVQRLFEFLLSSEPGLGVLHLGNLLPESPLLREALAFASGRGYATERSYVESAPFIQPKGAFDDYVQANFARKRELDRKSRRMKERFKATIGLVTDKAELPQAIHVLFDLHSARLSSRDLATRFAGDRRAAFHRQLSEVLFDADMLRLFQVKVDGVTIASVYAFQFRNELFAYQTGMDPGWKSHSPLFVLWATVVQYAFDNGLSRVDFMRGEQSYKLEWTGVKRDIYDVEIALNALGRWYSWWRQATRSLKRALRKILPDRIWRKMRDIRWR
jgi:CelD/BcsL family acetyltransferase involved in cellulose biosynthesis